MWSSTSEILPKPSLTPAEIFHDYSPYFILNDSHQRILGEGGQIKGPALVRPFLMFSEF